MLVYGSDYSLLLSYFPGCSRKQMKRHLEHLEQERGHELMQQVDRRHQLRKKSVFEEEVLEVSIDPAVAC